MANEVTSEMFTLQSCLPYLENRGDRVEMIFYPEKPIQVYRDDRALPDGLNIELSRQDIENLVIDNVSDPEIADFLLTEEGTINWPIPFDEVWACTALYNNSYSLDRFFLSLDFRKKGSH